MTREELAKKMAEFEGGGGVVKKEPFINYKDFIDKPTLTIKSSSNEISCCRDSDELDLKVCKKYHG